MQSIRGWIVAASLAIPAISAAQQPVPSSDALRSPRQSKVFVDVAVFGVADSLAHGRDFSLPFVIFGENASMAAAYPAPGRATGIPLDIGGGMMFTKYLGAGAAMSRTTYEHLVGLSATIPHPFFFNGAANATAVNDGALSARERALHTFVTFTPVRRDRFELRLLGGPSFFWYTASMVEDVLYTQSYAETTGFNSVAITGSATRDIAGSGIGFHWGGDFTYFVHHVVGIGVGTRYSQGVITLNREPLTQLNQDFRVGNTLVLLNVRLRLDRAFSR